MRDVKRKRDNLHEKIEEPTKMPPSKTTDIHIDKAPRRASSPEDSKLSGYDYLNSHDETLPRVGGTEDNQENECFFCGKGENEGRLSKCEFCDEVYYCSEDHFEIHRPENYCYPFIVKNSPDVGRYMIASRNLNPLELILKEHPAVVGPYSNTLPGCLQCFRKIDGSYQCSGCGFPVCNERCEKGSLHQQECTFFQAKEFKLQTSFPMEGNPISKRIPQAATALASSSIAAGNAPSDHSFISPKYNTAHVCITPLRMLLKERSDPKTFTKINMLMDHMEQRTEKYQHASVQMLNIVLLLQEACKMDDFNVHDVRRMIGILRTNGMKLEPHGMKGGVQGVALYPIYCLINHSCYNNTNYVKFPDHHLELRSQIHIRKGEQIFTRYISATIGNFRRREDIRRYWFFDCTCTRCSDSTELGTFMSAMLCFQCKSGYLLPVSSLDYSSDWICDSCQHLVDQTTVSEVVTTIENQVGELGDGHRDVNDLEEMLYHFSKLLHPNHYILIDIMHNLVHQYAAKKVLTRPEKERKIQLSLTVMDTLFKVDPGYTKWRGSLLQELIHTMMLIAKEDRKAERICSDEFQRRLGKCTIMLETAKKCLRGGFTPVDEFIREQQRKAKSKSLTPEAQNPPINGITKSKVLEIAIKLKNKQKERVLSSQPSKE